MGMLDIIKRAGLGAVEAGYPVSVLFGTVVTPSPLTVELNQQLVLTDDFFVLPEGVASKHLEAGDRLLLLRMQGGQSYVVLDRVS